VRSAKHIVAVNSDAGAPILSHAEYAVIGDLHEVIPRWWPRSRPAAPLPDPVAGAAADAAVRVRPQVLVAAS
jgi:hypothetical protein